MGALRKKQTLSDIKEKRVSRKRSDTLTSNIPEKRSRQNSPPPKIAELIKIDRALKDDAEFEQLWRLLDYEKLAAFQIQETQQSEESEPTLNEYGWTEPVDEIELALRAASHKLVQEAQHTLQKAATDPERNFHKLIERWEKILGKDKPVEITKENAWSLSIEYDIRAFHQALMTARHFAGFQNKHPGHAGSEVLFVGGWIQVDYGTGELSYQASPWLAALEKAGISRLRACVMCDKLFWAHPLNKRCCNRKCTNNLENRIYRMRENKHLRALSPEGRKKEPRAGYRALMNEKAKAAYIEKYGQQAYLALPWLPEPRKEDSTRKRRKKRGS